MGVAGALLVATLNSQVHSTVGFVETRLGVALLVGALAADAISAWLLICTACFDGLICCLMQDDMVHAPGGRMAFQTRNYQTVAAPPDWDGDGYVSAGVNFKPEGTL